MASDEVELPSGVTLDSVSAALRAGGAVFAYLHGSRVAGTHRPGSDVDVAAWFGQPTRPWNVDLPATVDLRPRVGGATSLVAPAPRGAR